jgi:putative ABC transport system permease protein
VKFLPLIWCGLWRKPARTLLTFLSITVAFLLFGLLQGVDSAFEQLIGQNKLDRMFVDPRFEQPVPYSYKAQIERVKGVSKITEVSFMFSSFREPTNGMLVIFTIPSVWLAIRPEYQITQGQLDKVAGLRTGVVMNRWLAEHNGWKVGDRITLKSNIPRKDGADWTFDIVALSNNTEAPSGSEQRQVLANWAYLDESRAVESGLVRRFLMRIEDAAQAGRIAREIDALFANSAVATRTQSEQDQAQSSLAQIGDFKFFTRAIMSAVFFALLFLTLNTTMESVRERTAELATLKTLGYPDSGVLALVLAESLVLFLVAAAIGLAIAAVLFPLARNFIPVVTIPLAVVVIGLGLAVLAAFVSAIVPAIRARGLNIVQALAVR